MAKLFNRAKMTTSTTGSGTVTLSAAANGFQSFADAGVSDGDVIQYVIEEGNAWEIGTGTYSATGTSLTRTPSESSNSGAAITLGGTAKVSITAVASQIGGGDRNLSFDDNAKAIFGAGSDLQIFHDSNNSYISDEGTGNLNIASNGAAVYINKGSSEIMASFVTDGAVTLYHDNSAKIATTSTGVDITGTLTSDGLTVDKGSAGTLATFTDGVNSNFVVETASLITTVGNTGGSTALAFKSANTERMRIDSSGKVGIGTTSPSSSLSAGGLHVSDRIAVGSGTEGTPALHYDADTDTGIFFGTGIVAVSNGGSESIRIDSSGNLLVGTTNTFPAGNNVVGTAIRPDGDISITKDGDVAIFANRKTSDGDIMQFSKDGTAVGSIGVAATDDVYFAGETGSTKGIYLNDNGVLPATTGGSASDATVDFGNTVLRWKDAYFSGTINAANFNTTSDATLKTNVETLTGSLDAVKAMRGVSYDWIENGNSEVGVIAQEVEEVIPDVVSTNDQGIKSVKYGNLVGVLIEAIKEQQAQIDELKAQLNS